MFLGGAVLQANFALAASRVYVFMDVAFALGTHWGPPAPPLTYRVGARFEKLSKRAFSWHP